MRVEKEIKSMSKCVCVCARALYLEVLDERPRVLDSVVFLQMEHPQIQQRQTAVTMETKPLGVRWKPPLEFPLKAPHFILFSCHPHKTAQALQMDPTSPFGTLVKNVGTG